MNKRCTIIFGNGLGMSIDSEYFNLKTALTHVWNNSRTITKEQRKLIRSALPNIEPNGYPESESMLEDLQMALAATEYLQSFEKDDISWLSEESKNIPAAFRKFIHEVALYFHKSNHKLPLSFVTELSQFIHETKSHIAVLNYDNLLYDSLCAADVCKGYNGPLIDGFQEKTGFQPKNLNRKVDADHGWYLHLHGSPLYIDNRKANKAEVAFLDPDSLCHIVLTHVNHKPFIIDSSKILSEYWSRLVTALNESNRIIVFGYSGNDTHLNNIIKSHCKEKPINIIEWNGSGTEEERLDFWKKNLNLENLYLDHYNKLTTFTDWQDENREFSANF